MNSLVCAPPILSGWYVRVRYAYVDTKLYWRWLTDVFMVPPILQVFLFGVSTEAFSNCINSGKIFLFGLDDA